jgi:hypothetical protein
MPERGLVSDTVDDATTVEDATQRCSELLRVGGRRVPAGTTSGEPPAHGPDGGDQGGEHGGEADPFGAGVGEGSHGRGGSVVSCRSTRTPAVSTRPGAVAGAAATTGSVPVVGSVCWWLARRRARRNAPTADPQQL